MAQSYEQVDETTYVWKLVAQVPRHRPNGPRSDQRRRYSMTRRRDEPRARTISRCCAITPPASPRPTP
jgi:hypothetical protein